MFGDHGLLGITRPEEFGGQGLDWSYACAFAEAIGDIPCGGVPMALGVQVDMSTPALAHYGSDELRREFLVPSITGEHVACVGVSEPGAGSDVAGITTRARKDGDDYVIDGVKRLRKPNSRRAVTTCNTVLGPRPAPPAFG